MERRWRSTIRTRWSWLAADKRGSLVIESGDGVQRHYDAGWDAERRTITLTDWDDDARTFELTFDDDAGRARFAGIVDGHAVEVLGERHARWLLEQPRFHWVQEIPFNR
jgi:hypothetical protein